MQMFDVHREQGAILIYIGDLDILDYAAHVQSNIAPNNTVVECLGSNIEENFYDTREKGLANASNGSDSTYMVGSDEREENVVNAELVSVSQLDMEEYSNMTNDEYAEYMGLKHSGKIVELECHVARKSGWRIHASPFNETVAFQIKTLKGTPHVCTWSSKNKSANSRWISRNYTREIGHGKKIDVMGLKSTVKRKFKVDISTAQVYRARNKAIESIQVVTTLNVPQEGGNILNKETRKGRGRSTSEGWRENERERGNYSSGRNCKERGIFIGIRNGRGRGYGGEKKDHNGPLCWFGNWNGIGLSRMSQFRHMNQANVVARTRNPDQRFDHVYSSSRIVSCNFVFS
ncbi:hypothetical protein M9H77_22651 [Catharanthus roseus]|uniref:Uncharacterized protein n=1 Tax=Catharanthus roseus TaxID=4058 RepID=A0ACC0AQS3_CATRO|nr:hypothetical protein M9H77_22651 [Catharanthus roseus]